MNRLLLPRLLAVAVLVVGCMDDPVQPASRSTPQLSQTEIDGRYIVELNGNADISAAVAAVGGTLEFAHADAGIATVSGLTPESAAALQKAQGVGAVYEDIPVELAPTSSEIESISSEGAEVASITNPAGAVVFSRQWNMRLVGANTAWAAGKLGSADITVAILDTGIDYDNHDMNGVVDLTRSASFVASDNAFITQWRPTRNAVDDLNGHGTNVATQVSSNAIFYAGINSRTKLIAVKVLGRTGSGSLSGILNGLIHAADAGADVANMSLGVQLGVNKRGNGQFIGATNRVFNYVQRQGMVVVVSAGNDAADMDNDGLVFRAYCEAPHVVCVSAVGPTSATSVNNGPWFNQDALAFYSNFGKAITVAAPGGTGAGFVGSICAKNRVFGFNAAGVPVFSCTPPSATQVFIVGYGGTSQASPHVAGLVAKLVEIHGKNNPAQVKHALVTSGADDLGAPGNDPVYGAGRINVAKALGL